MIISPVKTLRITSSAQTLHQVLDNSISLLKEGSVVAITSKIVSICEGNVVPVGQADKEELIIKEATYYLPAEGHKYGYHFSIVDHTLISSSGIDESNGNGNYILWPANPQKTANEVLSFLKDKHDLTKLGVIITDSTSKPLRRGAVGLCLAHSGFLALNDYRKTKDLFGHEFEHSVANIAEGLASAAVVTMGEGTEQTPLAVMEDLPFVTFQDDVPTKEELEMLHLTLENDYFEIFLNSQPWVAGGRLSTGE
jgi:F420-0:gamma-glutamyl ligase